MAADHPDAERTFREFVEKRVLAPIARQLDVDRPDLRAALVASQVLGLALVRYVLRLKPLATADRQTLVAAHAPTLQRYLLGPLD